MVKRVNKYSADLRSIAASRGHNSMHVDPLIRNTMMLNADEAQKVGVVNFVVNDKSELLKKLNGYYISQNGKAKKLLIEDTNFLVMEPTWHTQFLQMITKPTVAYLLFLVRVKVQVLFFDLLILSFFIFLGLASVLSFELCSKVRLSSKPPFLTLTHKQLRTV